MLVEELIKKYPRVYHMAESGTWESIKKHGLLSTVALLDLFEISGDRRINLIRARRPESETICHDKYGEAVIRDNKVLHDHLLEECLTDDLSPADWYEILNERAFFWPTRQRLETLLTATPYRNRPHCVLEVDTARLVKAYEAKISLSRINSGNTLFNPAERGLSTFMPISEYRHREVAELAVDYAVPDIQNFVVSVREMCGEVTKGRQKSVVILKRLVNCSH